MKRSISLVLCLAMLISVFSCFGLTASAAGDAKELFTVKNSGFKNDKITYTIYLNKGVNLSGAIIYASFDTNALAIDKANSGAYMVDDGDGGEKENIGGMYEADFMAGYSNQFSIAHAYGNETDYKNKTADKPYMQFTFKAIGESRPKTTVRFYCYEFNSQSIPENNIPNGSSEQFYKHTDTTLGQAVITSVASEKDGVRISWKALTGADLYRVYKVVDGENKQIYEGTDTSCIDADVKNNTSYTYRVRAVNEASYEDGNGNKYPAPISEAASTRYTVAPSKITASNDDEKVIVKWTAVEGATAYRVYRRAVDADGDVTTWVPFEKITATTYSDTTVDSGITYQYAVRVYSKGGNSDLYSEKEIAYLDIPEHTVKATTKGVKISWDAVEGAESYRIYRKPYGGSWERIKTVSSSTSYTDKNAPSGKKVYYMIKAVKGSYTSDYEAHSLRYIKTPVVKVKNISTGVNISWSKVGGATKYYVYRKAGSATSWKYVGKTTTGSYTDKTVKSGTTYKYCVRAIGDVKSAYGGSSYETIRFLSAPKLDSIKSTKSGITIYWEEVKGADGYIIYRKTGSGAYEEFAVVEGKSTVKYFDKTAEKGITYSYRVYATYDSYKSSYKSSLSIKDKY